MHDRPQPTPINRPFRSTFLCHLEADQRASLEGFGDLLESALLEYARGHGREPFNLTRARAVRQDREMLEAFLEETFDNWKGARGETGPRLRGALMEVFRTVSDARLSMAAAIDDEANGAAGE